MDYDVADMLDSLFGRPIPTVISGIVPTMISEAAPAAISDVAPMVISADREEVPNVEEVPDFDSLPPLGGPCPGCGGLEEWTDLLGRRRCGVCERDILEKAIDWASRAARLREQAQRQKPAPRIAPGCVAAGRVDMLTISAQPANGERSEALARA
jgi:hypothetical protein